ncbi:MAG: DUF2147 domain-containing protein [Pirellulales bacterium]|nr:DUF2147 domain-containing protein [Pirellulales bacterium]
MSRIRRTLVLTLAGLLILPAVALAADKKSPGDTLLGKWWFPKKNGRLEIVNKDGVYFGNVIAYYEDPEALDKNNPDESLRKRKFIGIEMLRDFTYDADAQEWSGGTIYDGDSGKTYKSRMWYKDGDPNTLNVRGFIGISILGRTEIFTRVTKEDEAKDAADAAAKEKEKEQANKDKPADAGADKPEGDK